MAAPKTIHEAWHRQCPMPTGATLAERVAWHREHGAACGCRAIPASVKAAMRRPRQG